MPEVSIDIISEGNAGEALDRLKNALNGHKKVKAGFPRSKASQSAINKAVWGEFGNSRGIPERPFFRNALKNNQGKYDQFMQRAAKRIATGQNHIENELELLGHMVVGDVQVSITDLSEPPNHPSTIKRKGSSNPLIDTGHMRQSATHELTDD